MLRPGRYRRQFRSRPRSLEPLTTSPHLYIPKDSPLRFSTPGEKNGLYWEKGNLQSTRPLSRAVATASDEGYTVERLEAGSPYYGYHFTILIRHGREARGGAMSYVDEQGRMTKGFGLLAHPAQYGETGVMTFVCVTSFAW